MARLDEEFETRWHQEAEAVMSGVKGWRLQHPKATFREIEAAVDEQLSGMRARLLEDLALASRAADLQDKQATRWRAARRQDQPADPHRQTGTAPLTSRRNRLMSRVLHRKLAS